MRKISMSSLKTVIFCVCVAMLVAVSLEAGIVMAQIEAVSKTSAEKTPKPPAQADVKAESAQPKTFGDAPTDNSDGVYMMWCDTQPGRVIVLDTTGKWLSTVESVEIKFEIDGQATIACTMHEGFVKTTKPVVKSFTILKIRTLPAPDFQKLVDDLQTDPNAIKNYVK